MRVVKHEVTKGTRILLGNEKRDMINDMINVLKSYGFQEISIPILQDRNVFQGKVGAENQKIMYNLTDASGKRELALAPEYTAVIQKLTKNEFKHGKNIRVFYVQECFRGENPAAGRYRQFTQLGVEILNPSDPFQGPVIYNLESLAKSLIEEVINTTDHPISVNRDVTRGLDYYEEGKGFEIACESLGAAKQICGGGAYDGGIGFAIGIDRLLDITML